MNKVPVMYGIHKHLQCARKKETKKESLPSCAIPFVVVPFSLDMRYPSFILISCFIYVVLQIL